MPINDENEHDYQNNTFPKCPHCDYEIEEIYEISNEGDYDFCCPSCNRDFRVSTCVNVDFSTSKID